MNTPKDSNKPKATSIDLGISGIYLDGIKTPVFKDSYMGYVFKLNGTTYRIKLIEYNNQKYLVLRKQDSNGIISQN